MSLSAIGVAVLFVGLVAVALSWAFLGSEKRKSDHWTRGMNRSLNKQGLNIDKLERVTRLEVIKAVIRGERCRGCSQVVDKDDLDVVGEDARNREIKMCTECRELMGLEDRKEGAA